MTDLAKNLISDVKVELFAPNTSPRLVPDLKMVLKFDDDWVDGDSSR